MKKLSLLVISGVLLLSGTGCSMDKFIESMKGVSIEKPALTNLVEYLKEGYSIKASTDWVEENSSGETLSLVGNSDYFSGVTISITTEDVSNLISDEETVLKVYASRLKETYDKVNDSAEESTDATQSFSIGVTESGLAQVNGKSAEYLKVNMSESSVKKIWLLIKGSTIYAISVDCSNDIYDRVISDVEEVVNTFVLK